MSTYRTGLEWIFAQVLIEIWTDSARVTNPCKTRSSFVRDIIEKKGSVRFRKKGNYFVWKGQYVSYLPICSMNLEVSDNFKTLNSFKKKGFFYFGCYNRTQKWSKICPVNIQQSRTSVPRRHYFATYSYSAKQKWLRAHWNRFNF